MSEEAEMNRIKAVPTLLITDQPIPCVFFYPDENKVSFGFSPDDQSPLYSLLAISLALRAALLSKSPLPDNVNKALRHMLEEVGMPKEEYKHFGVRLEFGLAPPPEESVKAASPRDLSAL